MDKFQLITILEGYNSKYIEEMDYKKLMLDFLNKNDIFLGRENQDGHITGSSWIIDKDRKKAMLTYHRKLDKWLQLGGHTEEGENVMDGALREAREESGLSDIKLLCKNLFDIDVHKIPAIKAEKEHYHYDVRFIFEADSTEKLEISSESKDLKWINLEEIKNYTDQWSVLRMVEKTYNSKF